MKTEKRLTMALSVLVALMMLAVPLASSSNLFVDGGQTNSNGDAPVVGASTGYTITFQLNADGKSLDQVSETELDTLILGLNNAANSNYIDGATWYLDENGDICALILPGKTVYVEQLIWALCDQNKNPVVFDISKEGYTLDSWKNESTGATYGPITGVKPTTGSVINKDMTFASQWTLSEGFVEVPVKVTFDGETKDYVKAYQYSDLEETKIDVLASYFNKESVYKIMGVKVTGLFVNKDGNGKEVDPNEILYTFTAKDSTGKDLKTENDDPVTINVANNSVVLDYTLKSIYSKITVKSIIFEEDVILYANVGISYSYNDVFNTLTKVVNDDGEFIFNPSPLTANSTINDRPGDISFDSADGSVLVNDKQYKATTWNGSKLLYSTENAVADLTLDATLNSYKVVFMVKGQYEVVDVPFGELSAKKCTLDVTGINRWVVPTDETYTAFKTFNFTDEEIKTLEGKAIDPKYVPQVFIAVFTPTSSTAYAVFDANDQDDPITSDANFGNELVKKIVIPGKDGDPIAKPSLIPELEGKNLFLGWADATDDTAFGSETYDKTKVQEFYADWESYKSSITFNGDKSVNGVIYFNLDTIPTDVENLFGAFVALSYNDKLYSSNNLLDSSQIQAFINAIKNILSSSKDGHYIDEWKDADGKTVIKNVDKLEKLLSTTLPTNEGEFMSWLAEVMSLLQDSINFEDLKGDVNFYANFVPEDYLIVYYANTATASNIMVQVGTVDEMLALFGESTFGNEGYVLKEWNTRPDGKGTSYALGSDFTLSGSEYEDALDVPEVSGIPVGYDKCVILYAIWEKVGGSGNEPGNNSEGNNTDTYLLAGILIVIIVLILLIAFLMRRKQ